MMSVDLRSADVNHAGHAGLGRSVQDVAGAVDDDRRIADGAVNDGGEAFHRLGCLTAIQHVAEHDINRKARRACSARPTSDANARASKASEAEDFGKATADESSAAGYQDDGVLRHGPARPHTPPPYTQAPADGCSIATMRPL